MNILIVHHDFPGQFRHLAPALAARHRVVALARTEGAPMPGVRRLGYRWPAPAASPPALLRRPDADLRRGWAVARAVEQLAGQGFVPDLVLAHAGWGEAAFLRDAAPRARLLLYAEYFHRAEGGDLGFDPAHGPDDLARRARTRALNAIQLLSLDAADWALSPTEWQASRYPGWARERMSVIHEGVDTGFATPDGPAEFRLPDGRTLRRGDPVVSYAARDLEPYRGVHSFLRALPALQARRPDAQVVIAGEQGVSYGPPPPGGGSWTARLLEELGPRLDLARIHFVGRLAHPELMALFRVAAAHVYLTYPFVLSWSVLEAMGCGAALLASDTAPVREVVQHGVNGRLVDFFDSEAIAADLADMLDRPDHHAPLRHAARRTILERYDLRAVCLPRQLALVERGAGAVSTRE